MSRSIQTGWVAPPAETSGLDPLGVQAPCIQIYGQLLPGITNVSDRARYYSFYPWLLTKFEEKGWRSTTEIIDRLRKADCLFSLIAIRHAGLNGNNNDHAGAAVGSNTLWPAVEKLESDSTIKLSDYAHREDGRKNRYFQNLFGGLGQYYFGVLWGLKLLAGESVKSVRIMTETSVPLAEAMSQSVPSDLFLQAVESDVISLDRLDALSPFCHCQLQQAVNEADLLTNVMRLGWPALAGGDAGQDTVEGQAATTARASSLGFIIMLAEACSAQQQNLGQTLFRGMTYSLSDTKHSALPLSESLQDVADRWQVYSRNELLAVAMQGLFFGLLRDGDLSPLRFENTAALSDWFWQRGAGAEVLAQAQASTFSQFIEQRCEQLPDFKNWTDLGHEIQLMEQVVALSQQKSIGRSQLIEITDKSLALLAAITGRSENAQGYGTVEFRPGYLQPYPVNLVSVHQAVSQTLAEEPLVSALQRFTRTYCLDSHLRVAMRKLRQQGQNTSRFAITENGIVIKGIDRVTHTSPRFKQAVRILCDLGLLVDDGTVLRASDKGKGFLESVA